jgi:hypothetical protein
MAGRDCRGQDLIVNSRMMKKMINKLIIYPAPEKAPRSSDYIVKVNGQTVDLYGAVTRYGGLATFGSFDFSGKIQLEVTATFAPELTNQYGWQILPEKYGVTIKEHQNGRIIFDLEQPAKLTFIVCDDYAGRTLHLFANTIETAAPSPNDPNVIYFGPGYHEIGESANQTIELSSNQTLYLAGGAFVTGFISAANANNVRICGRGVLSQPAQIRGEKPNHKHSVLMKDCQGIEISGIIINRNRAGWSGLLWRCRDIRIIDYKVISPAIWSTDGLNLANCSNAEYDDCFFRAGDDNIAIKGMAEGGVRKNQLLNPNTCLPNSNILIHNCIFWSDNNNAVVVGQESQAACYKDITFRDCDVLYVRDNQDIKAALAVICMHATDYRNILFENIRINTCGQAITVFYSENLFGIPGNLQFAGTIEGVTFRNITAVGSGPKLIRLEGWSSQKPLRNIRLENVLIDGKKVTEGAPVLVLNPHIERLTIQ